MDLTGTVTAKAVHERNMDNAEYREERERTALAHAVALRVMSYRDEHNLSQRAFGDLAGLKQANVSRLEAGDHEPSLSTLARLSAVLGEHFTLDVDEHGAHLVNA